MSKPDKDKDKDEDRLYRLRDMETREVSLVDRAANKRKFLIVKRGDAMPVPDLPELTVGDDGQLTQIEGGQDRPVFKLRSEWKEKIASAATSALEKIEDLIQAIKGAEETDEEGIEFPAEVLSEIQGIADAISGIPQGCTKAADAHQSLIEEKQAALKVLAQKIAGDELEGTELMTAIDQLSSIAWQIREPSIVASVSKADSGHWMSALKVVFGELRQLAEEIKQVLPSKTKPAATGANVGAGVQPDTEVVGTFDDLFKVEQLAELTKAVQELQSGVESLQGLQTEVRKAASNAERAQREVSALRGGVGLPSSDGDPAPVAKVETETVWPRDLNG